MTRVVRGFELDGLEQFRGGGGSQWMKIIPRDANGGVGSIDPRLKAIMARQLIREMTQERIVTDPELREAVGSLSVVSAGLYIRDEKILDQAHMEKLLINRLGNDPVDAEALDTATEINTNRLVGVNNPPFLPQGQVFVFDPNHWNEWIALIRAGTFVGQNVPQVAPAAANVPALEIHPWMFGGYLNIDLTNGQALAAPAAAARDPVLLSVLQILVGINSRANAVKASGMTLLALGTQIIASGGSITANRLRKNVRGIAAETFTENIDITRDMVLKGWNFLTIYWAREATTIGRDYQNLFQVLGDAGRRSSLRLALICDQAEFRLLTGIVITIKAIKGFLDFPWESLNDQIAGVTGRNELEVVARFAEFIAPDPVQPHAFVAQAQPAGGHWAGWLFAFEQRDQAEMKIANYPNLLYAALQLSILVGGSNTLRQYQGLDSHVVALRPTIDAWIGLYSAARAAAMPAFNLVGAAAPAPGADLTSIRGRRM